MYTGEHKKRRRFLFAGTTILSIIIVILLSHSFFSYKKLETSMQRERITALEEIAGVFSSRVELLRDFYLSSVTKMTNVISFSELSSFSEIRELYKSDGEKVLFATGDGKYININGEEKNIFDISFFEKVRTSKTAESSFVTVNLMGDYWAFYIAPSTTIVLDDIKIEGVILLVDDSVYADVAAIPLYNNEGASFVIDTDGFILFKPESLKGERLFSGVNAISSLREHGVDKEIIAEFKKALEDTEGVYQQTIKIKGDIWILQNLSLQNGRNITMTLPISITARETFEYMSGTVILFASVVIFIGLLLSIWIFYYIRRDQDMRLESAKVLAKSDFMSKVSHDIRTPLNAVIGLNQLALDSENDRAAVHEFLVKGKASGEYLLNLINDVLDMSKIESGKMTIARERFSMSELLKGTVRMHESAAKNKGVELSMRIETPITTDFEGDELRIQQCLMNLFSNAIKFTPEKGKVELVYSETRKSEKETEVCLVVRDTGIGMSEEFIKKIFLPFEQERPSRMGDYEGSGLGLSIVSSLVEHMGGTINVQSEQGAGSAFIIHLPLKPLKMLVKNEGVENVNKADAENRLKGKHVLVAEDSEINRIVVCKLLEKEGIIVDGVENGKQAVEKFEASRLGRYSVILLDINMPVMNGLDAARAIRALEREDAKSVSIVALSANAYHEDVKKSIDAGMNAHLAKPIDIYELKRTLNECISRKD